MAFRNPLVGGVTLIRAAIQSNPYVAGVSGWSINRDGTAEFNNGTFRGSLGVGTAPGARFIVNNPATGDILDVYNAANQLVTAIFFDGSIQVSNWSGVTHTQDFEINGGGNFFFSRTDTSETDILFTPSSGVGTQAEYDITVFNNSLLTPVPYELRLLAGSDNGALKPTALGLERGITGSLVQSDQTSTNNLTHTAAYSLVCNASGQFNQAHGCGFTPKFAQVTQTEPSLGGASPIVTIINRTGFTGTNFAGDCYTGAAHFSGTVTVTVTFWG